MPELFTKNNFAEKIELPKDLSFESKPLYEVLWRRRSHRYYKDEPISIADLSKLLYFSLGVSAFTSAYFYEKYPLRMYPTAGALNPIETYVSVQNVEGLNRGIYVYLYNDHSLGLLKKGDFSKKLWKACIEQDHVRDAAVNIILVAKVNRTYWKYGERAYRYVHLDCGHASQNVLLVATSLDLGSCVVGAFFDDEICEVLGIDCEWEIPMEVITIGKISKIERDYKRVNTLEL